MPMISVRPHRNRTYFDHVGRRKCARSDCGISVGWAVRTFPRASRAPSKKSNTPNMMNIPPNEVKATPISVPGFEELISYPSSVSD